MKKITLSAILTVVMLGNSAVALAHDEIALSGEAGVNATMSAELDATVCPQDAKLCPDGSYVGRGGPKCEFKLCPNPNKVMPTKPVQAIKANLLERKEIKTDAKNQIKTIRTEVKDKLQVLKARIASSTDKRKDMVLKRMNNRFDNMINRLQATIDREIAISERISSRIEKIKSLGGNTDEADKFLADAITNLAAAQTSLDSLKVSTEVAVSQENGSTTRKIAKETMEAMKGTLMDIEKHLREAHKLLEKAVKSLRGTQDIKLRATTTGGVNTNN